MKYDQTIITPKGLAVHIRSGVASDGSAVLENFDLTHAETDYLLSYPDENHLDAEQESRYLEKKATSPNEIELIAFVDGKVAGTAGIDAIGPQYKVAHRAEFGISILKEYWGLGIGRALMEACIQCAKTAGYAQLELEVVAENAKAISMYQTAGFVEYGRNPKGFPDFDYSFCGIQKRCRVVFTDKHYRFVIHIIAFPNRLHIGFKTILVEFQHFFNLLRFLTFRVFI